MVSCGFDCFKCSPKGIMYFEGHQRQNHLKSYKTIDSIVVCFFLREGVRQGDKRVSDL